jgi:hypothetical protein
VTDSKYMTDDEVRVAWNEAAIISPKMPDVVRLFARDVQARSRHRAFLEASELAKLSAKAARLAGRTDEARAMGNLQKELGRRL